jgi:Arc/MetJ-type ribon-helix-helix transcriptional regulator
MTIEIQQPELEELITQRMATGRFQSVADLLLDALRSTEESRKTSAPAGAKQDLAAFLFDSPLPNSGLDLERIQDHPRLIEL